MPPKLPPLSQTEAATVELSLSGLSLWEHRFNRYRETLDQRGVLDSMALVVCPDGQVVQTAGMLVIKQAPPTAKGVRFLTLEDERGFINIILYPKVYETYRQVIRNHPFLLVGGRAVKW